MSRLAQSLWNQSQLEQDFPNPLQSTGWTHWQITSSFRWQISTGHFCLIPTNPRPFRIARDQQRGHLRWPNTWHTHTHTPSCDQQSIVTVLSPHVLVYLGMYTVYINIHHIDRIFHEINHPAIGVPPYVYSISGRKLRFFSPDHSTVLAMSGRSTCQELMAWDKLQTSPSSA